MTTQIVQKPSFGAYILAVLIPPMYFFTRGRIAAGVISFIMLVIAIPFFLVFGLGIFIWFGNAMWAVWSLRYELVEAQAEIQANKDVEAFQRMQQQVVDGQKEQ